MTETQKEREERIQSSPQSKNGTFINPNSISAKFFSQETWEVTKDYIFTKRIDPKPQIDFPIHRLHPEQWEDHQEQQFSVFYPITHTISDTGAVPKNRM